MFVAIAILVIRLKCTLISLGAGLHVNVNKHMANVER